MMMEGVCIPASKGMLSEPSFHCILLFFFNHIFVVFWIFIYPLFKIYLYLHCRSFAYRIFSAR
jgi:hypothetical protein